MIERQIRDMGLYSAARVGDAAPKIRQNLDRPAFRYIAVSYAVLASPWMDELAEMLGFFQSII